MSFMERVALIIAIMIATVSTITAGVYINKYQEAQDKVEFYEKVIKDLGAEEFVHYPELYYEEGYIEQVNVHNCMWSIDREIETSNELAECRMNCGCGPETWDH